MARNGWSASIGIDGRHGPDYAVMQRECLNIPNVATFGELDRLQPVFSGTDIYFTYYETDDAIATIRWSIVRGLGKVVGTI